MSEYKLLVYLQKLLSLTSSSFFCSIMAKWILLNQIHKRQYTVVCGFWPSLKPELMNKINQSINKCLVLKHIGIPQAELLKAEVPLVCTTALQHLDLLPSLHHSADLLHLYSSLLSLRTSKYWSYAWWKRDILKKLLKICTKKQWSVPLKLQNRSAAKSKIS